jgi:hypothetical protein
MPAFLGRGPSTIFPYNYSPSSFMGGLTLKRRDISSLARERERENNLFLKEGIRKIKRFHLSRSNQSRLELQWFSRKKLILYISFLSLTKNFQ